MTEKNESCALSDATKKLMEDFLNFCACKTDDTEPCTCCAVLQYEIKTK